LSQKILLFPFDYNLRWLTLGLCSNVPLLHAHFRRVSHWIASCCCSRWTEPLIWFCFRSILVNTPEVVVVVDLRLTISGLLGSLGFGYEHVQVVV
jgi:hypothetical protein